MKRIASLGLCLLLCLCLWGAAVEGADIAYDEADAAPGAVPYAFDGFKSYVVIIGAMDLQQDTEEGEARLESVRWYQDAFCALSHFYDGYAPQTLENGNALISFVNQTLPLLDNYRVSRFDSSEVSEFDLYEIIFDAWYTFDPEGAAAEDGEPTVEMVEFVLYE